jgi:hypothetical protein
MSFRCLLHTILGNTKWRVAEGADFYWTRFDCASNSWMRREMSEKERDEAVWFWSIR